MACINQAGDGASNVAVLESGTGLGNDSGGGGSGGGGSSGAVFGPTAAGSAAANPPVLSGGTVDGTATGAVDNAKVAGGLLFTQTSLNAETTKVIGEVNQGTSPWVVSNGGTFVTQSAITAASGSIASGAIASGAVASGAFASGSIGSGAMVDLGAIADATATAGSTGSVSAKLRLATTQLATINTTLGTPMQASGGSVTANAGTNLNTSLLATHADVVTNSATSVHTCSTGGTSLQGCLGQIDDDVKGPIAAQTAPYTIIGGVINGADTYNTVAAS